MTVYVHYCSSPLGRIRMTSDGSSLSSLKFDEESPSERSSDLPVFRLAERWLNQYFQGKSPDFTVPLSFSATSFQNEVLSAVALIPYGKTMTYGGIAEQIAAKRGVPKLSAQAVGSALARNPIWLIIPCHRVIGKNGDLTGYAGGLARKAALLKMEQESC